LQTNCSLIIFFPCGHVCCAHVVPDQLGRVTDHIVPDLLSHDVETESCGHAHVVPDGLGHVHANVVPDQLSDFHIVPDELGRVNAVPDQLHVHIDSDGLGQAPSRPCRLSHVGHVVPAELG
jgi:hypothetical protein